MALLTHAVLLQTTIFVVRPTISYRALELGVPTEWLGLLAACFTIVPLGLALFVGRLADQRGERQVLAIGALLLVIATVTLATLGNSVSFLVLGSVLLGCGHLFTMLGEQSLVAGRGGQKNLVGAFGRFTLAQSFGQAVGPSIVAVLGGSATQPDTHRLFTAGVAAAAMMALVTTSLRSSPKMAPGAATSTRAVRKVLGIPGMPVALVASLTVIASIDLLVVYLPVLGTERHLAASVVGALLVLRALASMASRFFLSSWTKRFGWRPLLLMSLAGSAATVALLPVGRVLPALAIVIVAAGLALGIGQPLTMAWVAQASPPEARGTALSLRLSGNRLGQTVIPSVAGLCAAGLGTAGVFWFIAGSLGLTGVLVRTVRTAKG